MQSIDNAEEQLTHKRFIFIRYVI